ncbi:MAG: molybdate ABC transporter substrate-binding protein [Porticoccaceae bacterium]
MKYLLGLLLTLTTLSSAAAEVSVAVASNFTAPMKEIAAAFEQQSGHRTAVSFGSSGKLYAQIHNGAPFQLFLSADQEKPSALERDGLAETGTRFTYSLGTLVLLASTAGSDPETLLREGNYQKLALANPRLAPYGAAAMEVLTGLGLTETATPRQVLGENIAQTYQFVISGNAQLGFVARSQVAGNQQLSGRYWVVPKELYSPIRQDAVLLKNGADNPAALALIQFLHSDAAIAIMQNYGYGQPDKD